MSGAKRVGPVLLALLIGMVIGRALPRARDVAKPPSSRPELPATLAPEIPREKPPSGEKSSEAPGTSPLSKSDAAPAQDPAAKPPLARIDLAELEKLVTAGDWRKVRKLEGQAQAADLAGLFALLTRAPADLHPDERYNIQHELIQWIRSVPGDESSDLLLRALSAEGLVSPSLEDDCAETLAQRKYAPAIALFEKCLQGDVPHRVSWAGTSLLMVDRDRYLPTLADGLRRASDPKVAHAFLEAFRMAAWHTRLVDISPAFPAIQEVWSSTQDPDTRIRAMLTLDQARQFGSTDPKLRAWMLETAEAALKSHDPRFSEEELRWYRSLIEDFEDEE